MGASKLIIGCNFQQYESQGGDFTPTQYLIFDKIDDRQITAKSTIASQPMQSGDTISDHMYRNPDEYSVSGTFSLNGVNWNDNSYDFIQQGDRLTNIQHAFEKIKNEGILCTLITIDVDDYGKLKSGEAYYDAATNKMVNASTRFKIRRNMALNSITWTEMQNSVKFTFGFFQVIMVEAQEYVNMTEEMRKELALPSVNNPYGSSLGTVLSETGALYTSIFDTLNDRGYFDKDFLKNLVTENLLEGYGTIGKALINVATVAAVAAGVIVVGVVAAVAGVGAVTAAIFPVGTIIAAAAALVASVVYAVVNITKQAKEAEKKLKMFKLVNGSAMQDTNRLMNMMFDVESQINQIQSNVTVYAIQENKPQQIIMNIAGNYYTIDFSENNTNDYGWQAKVLDIDGKPISGMLHDSWCPVASFTDMNRNLNCWFRDNTRQYEVYLMNPALSPNYNPKENEVKAVRNELSSYTIWVSKGNIEDNVKMIQDTIITAIEEQGFTE